MTVALQVENDCEIVEIPRSIVEVLRVLLSRRKLSPSSLRLHLSLLRRGHAYSFRGRAIPYDELAEAFTYKYFGANYACNLALLERCFPNEFGAVKTIIDIGCGSGASALAHLVYANRRSSIGSIKKVFCLDRSLKQIDIARSILDGYLAPKTLIAQPEVLYYNKHISEGEIPELTSTNSNAWVVLSFVLSELSKSEALTIFDLVCRKILSGVCFGVTFVESTQEAIDTALECEAANDNGLFIRRVSLDGVRISGSKGYALRGAEPPKAITRGYGVIITRR